MRAMVSVSRVATLFTSSKTIFLTLYRLFTVFANPTYMGAMIWNLYKMQIADIAVITGVS